MAKHNKWSKVKRLKAVTDARRGKVFSRLARDLKVAGTLEAAFARGAFAFATDVALLSLGGYLKKKESLSARLGGCALSDLERMSSQVLTPSARVLETKGVPSIAEASALVAAGRNACLLGARIATDIATCAIAVGDGP